ncbi:MAG: hypothetical protein CM1200mP20_11750 [Pseudomonadota bacterium]|nr:MAG: hypothetical protein CM1200mP20_11750 [Pseudomonadota bacterium]
MPVVVLDDTHPDAVLAVAQSGELGKTLFVASSKSGTTAEVSALLAYFWAALESQGVRPEQISLRSPMTDHHWPNSPVTGGLTSAF